MGDETEPLCFGILQHTLWVLGVSISHVLRRMALTVGNVLVEAVLIVEWVKAIVTHMCDIMIAGSACDET